MLTDRNVLEQLTLSGTLCLYQQVLLAQGSQQGYEEIPLKMSGYLNELDWEVKLTWLNLLSVGKPGALAFQLLISTVPCSSLRLQLPSSFFSPLAHVLVLQLPQYLS